ncbi:MAG TPA: antitoxin Xre/MbcA/ParS toxin-binding domain-containing protein [Opitutaceae bacterium]|nr:antitoxin Xre/MbcA/ParS toxin-binding domain-containing protein [Opitutaceae bacterium]
MSTDVFQLTRLPFGRAIKVLRTGLAPKDFDTVAKALQIRSDVLAEKLGISVRTLRYQRSKKTLSPENSEKLFRAARVHEEARKVFTSDAAVSQWLVSPAPALGGRVPLELLDTDIGAREVENVLQGIAYGNVM